MDWPTAYTLDEALGVRVRSDRSVAHEYSDGAAAEAYILESIEACDDVSSGSDELVRRIRDWPSEYHFSASRATLLAPFDLRGLSVLEVGSGCGAVTRALGETGAHVVALEGSLERARITAARCRGLDNVEVVCDDFRDFQTPAAFDAVFMIGVLEYAPCYFAGADPIGAALAKARACLGEDGALVVAIENQLGLKYFAGCTEDHHGQAFFGIEDRYREATGPQTFGRGDLRRRLSDAGYDHLAWYYPFPDYKLPRLILTEQGMVEPRLPTGVMIGGLRTRDYTWPHPEVFAEDAAWDVVQRNGLIPELANSFLVVASRDSGSRLLAAPGWLAELRTSDRVRAYRTVTRFIATADGLRVTKVRAEAAGAEPSGSPVGLLLPTDSPLLAGSPLGSRVRRLLRAPDINADILAAVLRPWVDSLRSSSSEGGSVLPGDLLDLVPWNLMEPDGRPLQASDAADFTPFDLEWEYRPDLTIPHVVFRGLASVLLGVHGRSRLADEVTRGTLLQEVGGRLGVSIDPRLAEEMLGREAEIQSAVFGMDQSATLETLTAHLDEPLGGDAALEVALGARDARIRDLMLIVAEREAQVAERDARVAERDARVDELARLAADREASLVECSHSMQAVLDQLSAVEASTSWRLTAPLRRLRRHT